MFTGQLSLRRFSVLLQGLPPGALTWRVQGGPLAWSEETHAALLVRNAIQQFQASFAKKPSEVPLPEPPAWGHVELAEQKRDIETRRLRRFSERNS